MASLQVFKGKESDLASISLHEGYLYFCEDTGNVFIDGKTERIQVNAHAAEILKNSSKEIDLEDLLLKDEPEDARNSLDVYSKAEVDDKVANVLINIDFVPIDKGGTGAKTKEEARTNLEVDSSQEVDDKISAATANFVDESTIDTKIADATADFLDESAIDGKISDATANFLDGTTIDTKINTATSNLVDSQTVDNKISAATANLASKNDVYNKTEVDTKVSATETKSHVGTLIATDWKQSGSVFTYDYKNSNLRCGANDSVPPMICCIDNNDEYNNIISAIATAGQGIAFTATKKPTKNISLVIVDLA